MRLLGLHGRAGSGKDTAARFLISGEVAIAERGLCARIALADPLKDAAAHLFDIPRAHFDDPTMKDRDEPYWNGKSPRRILQLLGTEAMRTTFGADHWIRLAERRMKRVEEFAGRRSSDSVLFIITDVRFVNEAEWVIANGGKVVHIVRDDAPAVAAHASEIGLPQSLIDITVHNNGTLGDFRAALSKALSDQRIRISHDEG